MVARRIPQDSRYIAGMKAANSRAPEHDDYSDEYNEHYEGGTAGNPTVGRGGAATGPVDPSRLIGTREWQKRRRYLTERRGKNYSQEREIKALYRHLEFRHELVESVNASSDTEDGKELSAALVNYLELESALDALHVHQQWLCWNVCIVGRMPDWNGKEKRVTYRPVERMTYAEVAVMLRFPNANAVAIAVMRAKDALLQLIYDSEDRGPIESSADLWRRIRREGQIERARAMRAAQVRDSIEGGTISH